MIVELDKPFALRIVDRLTFWLAAIPDSVSPDLTLYVLPDEPEDEELDVVETEEGDEVLDNSRL